MDLDDAKINHRTARLKELNDKQLATMYHQFERWRYKTPEQHAMVADLNKEINRRKTEFRRFGH